MRTRLVGRWFVPARTPALSLGVLSRALSFPILPSASESSLLILRLAVFPPASYFNQKVGKRLGTVVEVRFLEKLVKETVQIEVPEQLREHVHTLDEMASFEVVLANINDEEDCYPSKEERLGWKTVERRRERENRKTPPQPRSPQMKTKGRGPRRERSVLDVRDHATFAAHVPIFVGEGPTKTTIPWSSYDVSSDNEWSSLPPSAGVNGQGSWRGSQQFQRPCSVSTVPGGGYKTVAAHREKGYPACCVRPNVDLHMGSTSTVIKGSGRARRSRCEECRMVMTWLSDALDEKAHQLVVRIVSGDAVRSTFQKIGRNRDQELEIGCQAHNWDVYRISIRTDMSGTRRKPEYTAIKHFKLLLEG
ncbi:hypothetical protein AAG570_013255 [Ranatra chinensis]|uniref:Uncharacterized protein n=1 Tax=Ranatra chinensis TaxID=642074 RepID=A0ABD0YSP5_9HEMI